MYFQVGDLRKKAKQVIIPDTGCISSPNESQGKVLKICRSYTQLSAKIMYSKQF